MKQKRMTEDRNETEKEKLIEINDEMWKCPVGPEGSSRWMRACPNLDVDCPRILELEEQRDRAIAFIEVLLTPPSVEERWAYSQHTRKVMEARKAYEEVCPAKEKKDG